MVGRSVLRLPLVVFLFVPVLAAPAAEESVPASEIRLLREELARLRDRVDTLESELRAERATDTPPAPLSAPPLLGESLAEYSGGSGAEEKAVAAAATAEAPETPEVTTETAEDEPIRITGAVRFNTSWVSDEGPVEDKRGESGLDLFRIGAEGERDGFSVSAEYRFYPFMETIHHGWVGYAPNDRHAFEAGITRVPFGLLPFASHNFWFGTPYYLGLADDYDVGLKYRHENGPWDLRLAFFKNEELNDASNLERYSFDVVTTGNEANEETNQINARLAHTFGEGTDFVNEVGVSGQCGQLYNGETSENGDYWALAAHLDSRYKRWNFQLQLARYAYNPENPPGVDPRSVRLGAFATSYDVASEATVLVGNVAYNFPVPFDFLDSVTGYNDFSAVFKDEDGVAVGMGPLLMYLDFIQARNMVFFGDGSLAGGGNDDWDLRANLNVGYYW